MNVCLFTSLFSKHSIEETAKASSEIGFKALELQAPAHIPVDSTQEQVREVKSIMDNYGLAMAGIFTKSGASYATADKSENEKKLEEIRRFTEICQVLKCKTLVHSPGGPNVEEATEEQFDWAAEWMAKAGDICAPHGIKIAMEIHPRGLVETLDSSLKLVEKINHSHVGLVFDFGNLAQAGEDYGSDAVKRLSKYIYHVHMKDILFFDTPPEGRKVREYKGRYNALALMGEGSMDLKPGYRALAEIGYDGYISCEARVDGVSPKETAAHEFRLYNETIKEINKGV